MCGGLAKAGSSLLLAMFACLIGTSGSFALQLEEPRALDETYQRDRAEYSKKIRELRYELSVRAGGRARKVLLGTQVYIVNLGRAEAYAKGDAIYFDMALLDLLSHFADELSVAEIKQDVIHQLEFNLAYAVALNYDKQLELLDPYNTVPLTEAQNLYLWNAKLQAEAVIFDNLLGFILAHEFSHLIHRHRQTLAHDFPDEGSRTSANPAWTHARRAAELEADEMAAQLCLNALIQPAQVLPWLLLTQIRRRYYGQSAEYPTPAQRIAVIQKVYEKFASVAELGGDLRDFAPLPPDKDVTQVDYQLFLTEFRKVRKYRQTLLAAMDRAVVDTLKDGHPRSEALAVFIAYMEQQKDLLAGAAHQNVLAKLRGLVASAEAGTTPQQIADISNLVKQAGIGPHAKVWLLGLLDRETVDWPLLAGALELLQGKNSQFLLGLTYDYMLANSVLRWDPGIFAQLQGMLPDTERKAKQLKPFVLDKPVYQARPSFAARVEILRQWNGKYPSVGSVKTD